MLSSSSITDTVQIRVLRVLHVNRSLQRKRKTQLVSTVNHFQGMKWSMKWSVNKSIALWTLLVLRPVNV